MKKNNFILAIALASQAFAVSVDFFDEQQNNSSATGVRLRINNDSNAPITDAKIRYYYHRTSSPDTVDAYYLPNATVSKSNVNDTLAYFELNIPSIPVGYYPDMTGFSLALHNQNWSSRDKSKDYSYQASSSLMENAKVVLLSGDNVIFGEAPNVQFTPEPGILKISGLKFSDSSWLEIKNVGGSAVALSEFQLVNTNDSVFSLGNDSLAANEILRICQNQAACGTAEKSLVNSTFGWASTGEAFLKKDTSMTSYVAWGQAGSHAAAAVEAGVWNDSLDYFPAETRVQQYNADYTKNTFFRLKSNKSGAATNDWFAFTSNDDPAETVSAPLPIKISANQPVYKLIPGENDVLFSWLPVQGVNSYRVVVRDQNGNDVYNQETSGTSVSLALAPGNYDWTVIGEDEFWTQQNQNGAVTYNLDNLMIESANINTSIFKQLKIHKIKARRDTKMLDLNYLKQTYQYSWDRPNLEAKKIEWHEETRCWAVATEVMNHFYGGNLTQDEIVYHGLYIEDDPLLSPFRPEGGGMKINLTTDELILDPVTGEPMGNLVETLKWALKVERLNYGAGAPSYQTVKNAIDNEKLIYLNVPNHAMVIYGYVGDASNYAFYYAFVDNNGSLGTSLNHLDQIKSYFIPNVTYGNVEMSNPLVHMDSDGDGITDFEETTRFCTEESGEKVCLNKHLVDFDNDGIEDKREIYNYTISAHSTCSNCTVRGIYNVDVFDRNLYEIRETYDENKNGIPAERDPDDNGDGVEDGLSFVLNFDQRIGSLKVIYSDIPGDYTIFGREYVRINDGVKCYNTPTASEEYCNIAAADEDVFSYGVSYSPISIGVRAHVGNIDFCNRGLDYTNYPNIRDKSELRSNAVVHGAIKAYVKDPYAGTSEYIAIQNGASAQGGITLGLTERYNWTSNVYLYSENTYSAAIPSIPKSQIKVVHNGETYRLKDGDQFNTLRVESGATLIIEPGEMYVDEKLQIEPNSTVSFADPGKGSVLHTNGEIIWRARFNESANNSQYWTNVARGFKLVHHSSKKFYIGSLWAGTIYAPKASVIMGQASASKTLYGRILARNVIIHQYSKVYRVDFNPTDAMQVSYAF